VQDLTLAVGEPTSITWDQQGSVAGPGTSYDLMAGDITATSGVNFGSAACLQSGGPTPFSDTSPAPTTGAAYWYRARGRNSCGIGTYGTGRLGLNLDGKIP